MIRVALIESDSYWYAFVVASRFRRFGDSSFNGFGLVNVRNTARAVQFWAILYRFVFAGMRSSILPPA